MQFNEEVQHLGLHAHIQGGHGLVAQQNVGVGGKGAGDDNALALSAGKGVGPLVQGVCGQSNRLQEVGRFVLHLGGWGAPPHENFCEHAPHLQRRVQSGAGVLENEANVALDVGQLIGRLRVNGLPGDVNGARIEGVQAQYGAGQGGLSTSAPPHNAEAAPFWQFEGNPVQGRDLAARVGFGGPLDGKEHRRLLTWGLQLSVAVGGCAAFEEVGQYGKRGGPAGTGNPTGEQSPRVGVFRRVENRLGPSLFDHIAAVQDRHLIGVSLDDVHVVRHQHHGQSPLAL